MNSQSDPGMFNPESSAFSLLEHCICCNQTKQSTTVMLKLYMYFYSLNISGQEISKLYLFVKMGNPFSKLPGIRNGCRKEDIVYIVWQQNDGLFPHNTSL